VVSKSPFGQLKRMQTGHKNPRRGLIKFGGVATIENRGPGTTLGCISLKSFKQGGKL